jgi:hypothetical protein
MLTARHADGGAVIHRALLVTALVCCALVAASFVLFARDELAGASKHQQNEIASATPAATPGPKPIHEEGQPRRTIDTAAHVLTTPFRSIVQSDSQWVQRGLPTILALLLYGAGLGYLARYSRGWS